MKINNYTNTTFYTHPEKFSHTLHSEQFHHFTSKGFTFGIIKENGGHSMAMGRTEDELIQNHCLSMCEDESDFLAQFVSGLNHEYITTVNPSVAYEENLHFLCYFYKKYPQYSDAVLRNYHDYIPNFIIYNNDSKIQHEDRLLSFASILMNNLPYPKALDLIPNFHVYTWSIKTIPLPKLVNFLKEKNFNDIEIDQTLFLFLKARHQQLEDMKISTEVKYYLLEHYCDNIPLLDKYFEFIPILKSHFETPNISFVKNIEELSINLIVNTKDMKSSFLIDQWNISDYTNHIENVVNGIKQYYHIPTAKVVALDSNAETGNNIGIFIMHDKPEYTKKWFEKIFTDFFSYLRTDPTFTINVDNVSKWCHNKDLHAKIDLMNLQPTTTNKKIKI